MIINYLRWLRHSSPFGRKDNAKSNRETSFWTAILLFRVVPVVCSWRRWGLSRRRIPFTTAPSLFLLFSFSFPSDLITDNSTSPQPTMVVAERSAIAELIEWSSLLLSLSRSPFWCSLVGMTVVRFILVVEPLFKLKLWMNHCQQRCWSPFVVAK